MHEMLPRGCAAALPARFVPSPPAPWPNVTDAASLERLEGVLTELLHAVDSVLRNEHESALGRLRRAAAALQLLPDCFSQTVQPSAGRIRQYGGLAPWQVRRVTNHIECQIDTTIRTEELAALVRLSSFHFCRTFRGSFGQSPQQYVTRRRIERAQGLMLTTDASLGQIALECGMSDQPQFNKLFRRIVGETPGAWRRARSEDLAFARERPRVLKSVRLRHEATQ
jgi:AraC family transcriptional regulator